MELKNYSEDEITTAQKVLRVFILGCILGIFLMVIFVYILNQMGAFNVPCVSGLI
jgi:hypothetical protein